ncbi:hypothetical protein JCGZ_08542 [Jatropha curcas]|uniref:DUF674 family protein n=1 Tax=Jatropha curcas TaxID=180498 RepID=A0A067LNX1_JATCU|nr:hypothetical protein JCGZ_08542 [Jatropha curcas]
MPIGTIVRLTNNQQPITAIGCMNNLYASVENLDVKRFRTEACKTMLLRPKNGSATQYKDLKLKIDSESPTYFYCGDSSCIRSKCKLLSQYAGSCCGCGKAMNSSAFVDTIGSKESLDGGVFVKEHARFVISDELQVMHASTAASFPLISKLGILDATSIEERIFDIGLNEVLSLQKSLFISKFPLTKTLLKPKELSELGTETSDQSSLNFKCQIGESASKENGKICVRLVLSKSKKRMCYAEVGEDFVDLLFSFLTIPLGFIIKKMNGSPSKGCINHLYNCIKDLDSKKYFKSDDHKEILLSPKIAPDFGYEKQLLGVEEASHQQYYYVLDCLGNPCFFMDNEPSSQRVGALTVKDPKSPNKKAKACGGFVMKPAMFTVTDDLIVTPISPVSGISILNKLNVPFNDIEERVVYVGNEEASGLLVASCITESALTESFLQEKKNPENPFRFGDC